MSAQGSGRIVVLCGELLESQSLICGTVVVVTSPREPRPNERPPRNLSNAEVAALLQAVYSDIHHLVDALAAAGTYEEALRMVAADFKLELWQAMIVIDQQLWNLTGKARTDRAETLRQARTDDDPQ